MFMSFGMNICVIVVVDRGRHGCWLLNLSSLNLIWNEISL
ncbi:hypothetical protein PanWU01x14_078400 [Parasponia andersonii]|uniref:Uncharacterized protein n=1 Tax=Parasponia andersonii TaxID=3476 RepID=A0A2P5DBY8_PARAD|nr:hypothetical protein PanWU01x14_078400 [Parasponia andersonii]